MGEDLQIVKTDLQLVAINLQNIDTCLKQIDDDVGGTFDELKSVAALTLRISIYYFKCLCSVNIRRTPYDPVRNTTTRFRKTD